MESFQPETPSPQAPPKNWLVESILVTMLCCLPFGIVGIVFASQVNSKFAAGGFAGAVEASGNAAKWTKIGFWIGAVVIIGSFTFSLLIGGWGILRGINND